MSSSILIRIQNELIRYGMSIVLVLGVIGNFFLVILLYKRRSNSTALYLLVSAIFNTLSLVLIIPLSIYNLNHPDPLDSSLILCKLRWYFSHSWGQTARYLLSFACIDRYLLTINNVRFAVFQRPKTVRGIVCGFIIGYHLFMLHLAIFTRIANGACGQYGVYYILYQTHVIIFFFLIPFLLMSIFGYLTYRNLKRLHTRIRPVERHTKDDRGAINVHRQDRDLYNLILSEVLFYFITTAIYPFIQLEVAITTYINIKKSTEYILIENFLTILTVLLIHIDSSISFYLYLIASESFRKDFGSLLNRFMCWLQIAKS